MNRGVLCLALYIVLRGSDSTLLKALQQAGARTQAAGAGEPISFCNVFFFASLVSGLALVLLDRKALIASMPGLQRRDRILLALQGFSGFFLGPVAFYLALDRLSVVQQTLLFSLTLPCTTLAARLLLREALPRSFVLSCALITGGLLLASHGGHADAAAAAIDGRGVVWALLGVVAFALSGVLGRLTAQRGLGVGLTVGLNSLAAAVAFGAIALILFGPGHFFYLQLWWVLGVIGGYALAITLGSQWSLIGAYAALGVVPVTFWAALTIVIAIASAHVFLGEPLHWGSLVGAALILVAIAIQQLTRRAETKAEPG